jgi:hypothetical protein
VRGYIDVHVGAFALGVHEFVLTHSVERSASKHHGAPATRLHWPKELHPALAMFKNFSGKFVVIERDESGAHRLSIVEVRPEPVV